MIVLSSNKLKDIALDLGNKLNEIMQVINEIHAYNPDSEFLNKSIRELRNRYTATYVKGNVNMTMRDGNMEVTYVLTANGYKDAIKNIVDYFADMLMAIKQVMEFTEKLGLNDEYVVMMSDSSIDILIGYSLPDMSNTPLLRLPSIRETAEVPSILGGFAGLTADELAKVMIAVDNVISVISSGSRNFETVIRLSDVNYPEPFRKIEELIGGSS